MRDSVDEDYQHSNIEKKKDVDYLKGSNQTEKDKKFNVFQGKQLELKIDAVKNGNHRRSISHSDE